MRHFIRQMRRLEQAGIPAIVIAGNHDTPRVRTGGSAYSVLELALPGVTFVTEFEDAVGLETFADHGIVVQAIPHGALTNPDPVIPDLRPGVRNIMTTHGLVPGVLPDGIVTEPGEQLLDHLLLDSRFDYIALGHIHQAQQISANAWYAGSSERFGWNDVTATPGYNLVEFTGDGLPTVTRVDLPARAMIALPAFPGQGRDGRTIADTVLERLGKLAQADAMVRVDIRDSGRPIRREVHSILRRESIAIVWHVDLAPERSIFLPQSGDEREPDPTLDLHMLFQEFVAQRRGSYPNEDFATAFLERGSRALTDAIAAESAPAPEEDAIS